MRFFSRTLLTIVLAVLVGGLAVGACLAALIPGTVEIATAHHYTAEQVGSLKALAQPTTIYWNDGTTPMGTLGLEARDPITSIDQVPKVVQDAIIATEDRTFWTNDGIDLGAVFRAFLTNVTSGEIEQGGSTITQQLVKNRILTSKRDVNRKIKEIEDALRLNEKFSKDKIFVEYLNTIYFGSGSYGIKAAASRFFFTPDPASPIGLRGKHLDELTIGEAALLAGVISNPEGNSPFGNTGDRAIRRRADVLRGMVEEKYITQEQADAANNEPLPTVKPSADQRPQDFLVAEVQDKLLNDTRLGATAKERLDRVLKGGLTVTTSFDLRLQTLAQEATTEAKPNGYDDDWLASLVAIDPTNGAVRAMVGGQDFSQNQFNIATSANGRQTGSTFKVITLAAALMNGYSPNDQVDGTEKCPVPSKFPDVPPEQYPNNSADGAENGYHTLDHSTAASINCAFVRLATSVGYDKVIATAHAMGITKDLPTILNLTLGTIGQNTQTMASVMATIANRGVAHAPFVVQKVVAPDGQVLIDETSTPGNQALSTDVADCEQNVMRDVITGGTGTKASVGSQQLFGKTGTTDRTTDAWFIGANPQGSGQQLATAVWFGNRFGAAPGAGFGGDSAAPIFRRFMSDALGGQVNTLPDPGPVCARQGGFVNPDGGRTMANPNVPVVPVTPIAPQLPTVQQQPTTPTPTAAVPSPNQ